MEAWFEDEARFGQQGTLTRIWARKGTRPRAPRDCRYAWAYLFGAVCPARGIGAGLVLPAANARTTFFENDGARVVCDPKSLMFLDGMTIAWKNTLQEKGFQLENPNVKKSCGCGNSVEI